MTALLASASTSASKMPRRSVCVVVHDVAPPTWPACLRLIDAIGEVGSVPLTLLAVPRYHGARHDAGFDRWLRERAALGDEVALHGYTHRDDGTPRGWIDRLRRHHYTRAEGEFWDLSPDEAVRRLQAGCRWFEAMGLPLHGFVAPAWLLGAGAWEALARFDLDYTCTLGGIWRLRGRERRFIGSQSLVYSHANAWRRAASRAWNRSLAEWQRHSPLLRLELHPPDASHVSLVASWQGLLRSALRDRVAETLSDWVNGTCRPPASPDQALLPCHVK